MDREHLDEEAWKTHLHAHSKDCAIITATVKRPSAHIYHQQTRKRRKIDDGLAEGGLQRTSTYVTKVFDQSMDLAQCKENTLLYPISGTWMGNGGSLGKYQCSPTSLLTPIFGHAEGSEVTKQQKSFTYNPWAT
ncbi:protein lin-37-like protein [Camelus ferus]|nr:protein lin-37-like protein [Camelus ferus]